MAKSKSFIDSNLWIYALLDGGNKKKHDIVLELLENLVQSQIVLSIQVINEVHWVLKRKYKLSELEIKEKTVGGIFPIAKIAGVDKSTYLQSAIIREKYSISFWDSLIVSSAIENSCGELYSEDLQDGVRISNSLSIVNPLK
jgi:predicted nucleic acid-binding protein